MSDQDDTAIELDDAASVRRLVSSSLDSDDELTPVLAASANR